ncbi:MAG: hypothetical protein FWH29_08255 [Methanobrevibacter sp.]|nr:hypothetical protein [Methanobrevibacter sp.]
MLITKEEYYEGIANEKYLLPSLELWAYLSALEDNILQLDYDEFITEKFLKQSNYEFVMLPDLEVMFSFEYGIDDMSLKEYKKYYKEYQEENAELEGENEILENGENSIENREVVFLRQKNDKELDLVFDADLNKYYFKTEQKIHSFMEVAKIFFNLKYEECIDFACIIYKLIYNESPFAMKNKDLTSNQQEVFFKAKDFLNIVENFDQDKYKLLFEFLAKYIRPPSFKKKSVMFTENQIANINSIDGKGFSENLRFVVDRYFNDFKKENYTDKIQLNEIVSSIIVAFSTKVGLYTKNINEGKNKHISKNEKEKFWDVMETSRETILYILKDTVMAYNKSNLEKLSSEEKTRISFGTLRKIAKSNTKSNNEILMWNNSLEQLDKIFGLGLIASVAN